VATTSSTVRRNSLRYPGYDYSQPGAIFVTIRTHDRQRLFGSVVNGEVALSPPGVAAERYWLRIPERFPGAMVDSFVIMPDHVHGILLMGTDPNIEAGVSVPDIVGWFKVCMRSTYRKQVKDGMWLPYQAQLWQRSFNDRIIRNDREFEQIHDYIEANPARWQERYESRG